MNGAAVQIMDTIRCGKGNVSKKDIQRLTGLSWGTMCKCTDQLIENGYIFARREKAQGRGRPTIPLCVNSDAAYYIGVDIGAASTRAAVCGSTLQPKNSSCARTACITSIGSPPDAGRPSARARTTSSVRSGL